MKKITTAFIACMLTFVYAISSDNPVFQEGKVILENDKLKVTMFESMPKSDVCGKDTHNHSAHLTVLLTEAEVAVTSADGKTATQKVPAGTTFWSDAETHKVVNVGKSKIKAEIIELK